MRYALRCGVHNGRAFLGGVFEEIWLAPLRSTGSILLGVDQEAKGQNGERQQRQQQQLRRGEAGEGRRGRGQGSEGAAEGMEVGWVPRDDGLVVVVQLVGAPAAEVSFFWGVGRGKSMDDEVG